MVQIQKKILRNDGLIEVSPDKYEPIVRFGVVTTSEERSKIYKLREIVYKNLAWIHLLSIEKELSSVGYDKFDDNADIFFLEIDGSFIASCRIMPVSLNTPFLEKLLIFNKNLNIDSSVVIERLVLNENFRNNFIYKKLLTLVCHWVHTNTHNTIWYAKCVSTFTPLYLRFGAKIIGRDKQIIKRVVKEYDYLEGVIKKTHAYTSKFMPS